MEENKKADGHKEDEESESEYVLLDLDAVSGQIDIPPNAPFTLSSGEYEETIGTCFVFTEHEAPLYFMRRRVHQKQFCFSGKCIIDPNQAPRKRVKPVTGLHKVLKFRLLLDVDVRD